MSGYNIVKVPKDGAKITMDSNNVLTVPDNPILPFIEGDGIGPDIWKSSVAVFDAAIEKAYGGRRKVHWMEVYAGEKSFNTYGEWLPDETIQAFREFLVGIKGPLTTPIGGGFRSLNVALRQILDLYVCLRPVRYINNVPSPVKRPELVDMVIFRENTEDIYAGIEWAAETPEVQKVVKFLREEMGVTQIRFPKTTALGVKTVSVEGSQRLIGAAIEYALRHNRKSVTFAHKGNVMKYTEGAFAQWGYELAASRFRNETVAMRESWIIDNKDRNPDISVEDNARGIDPGYDMMSPDQQNDILDEVKTALKLMPTHGNGQWKDKLMLKDVIADIVFQQTITRADEFDVIATMNLNGDYLSDALAAQVGGIGIAPGGNINFMTGHAIFEATHGTAPKYANLDKVNPSSVILSGVMMFEHLGWQEVADFILKGIENAIGSGIVTYDFARLMKAEGSVDVTEVGCSQFGQTIIDHMG